MRVLLVTQDEPLYLPEFFRAFLDRRAEHLPGIGIAGIVLQRPLGTRSRTMLVRRLLAFYGSSFARLAAVTAAAHVRERLHRMGLRRTPELVPSLARAAGVPVWPLSDVNRPDFAARVRAEAIDLVVSVSASQIFKREILETPPRGCINLHNGALPHYRGMLPNFWQMLHGERVSVLTIHRMVEKVDRGDIVLRRETPIEATESLDALIRATKRRSADALWEVLRAFRDDAVHTTPLPEGPGSYHSFPTAADRHRFRAMGKRFFG